LRLGRITGRADLEHSAKRTLEAFATRINQAPFAAPLMVSAFEFSRSAPKQLVLSGDDVSAMERVYHAKFLPDYVLLRNLPEMPPINGKATAYVCENLTCKLPVTGEEELAALLQ